MRYPGDLWGLDSRGDLLIVETKLQRNRRLQDPFEDFVPYCKNEKSKEYWRSRTLESHWGKQFRSEKRVLLGDGRNATLAAPPTVSFPGVVPFSSRGAGVRHWPWLFQRRIAPGFSDGSYEAAVRQKLRLREARENKPPIFIGLVGIIQKEDLYLPRREWGRELHLSSRGWKAFAGLREHVGIGRVHLRAVRAHFHDEDRRHIQIRCWTPLIPAKMLSPKVLSDPLAPPSYSERTS